MRAPLSGSRPSLAGSQGREVMCPNRRPFHDERRTDRPSVCSIHSVGALPAGHRGRRPPRPSASAAIPSGSQSMSGLISRPPKRELEIAFRARDAMKQQLSPAPRLQRRLRVRVGRTKRLLGSTRVPDRASCLK